MVSFLLSASDGQLLLQPGCITTQSWTSHFGPRTNRGETCGLRSCQRDRCRIDEIRQKSESVEVQVYVPKTKRQMMDLYTAVISMILAY